VNWMKPLCHFPVFFWALGLSLGIHGLTLVMPLKVEPTKPQTPPLATISLIPLPPEPKLPTSKTPPTSIAPPLPIPQPTNLQESPPPEDRIPQPIPKDTPTVKPIDQTPTKPSPTQAESNPEKTTTPIPEIQNIESPEQFTTRTQTALTQVTGKLGQQYGNRFSERSETIAASPELFFMKPELFYDTKGNPLPGFDRKPFQIEKETPEKVFNIFEASLQKAGFTVSPLENYGGGLLYEVKSKKEGNPEKIAFYLNLLLIPDKSGTIVVIWKQNPQK
jgi:hypothetical protein